MHGWTCAWLYMLSQTLKLAAHIQYLPPATKLRQGNIFISVCDSVHGGGGVSVQGVSVWGPLSRGSLSREGLCPGGLSVQGGLCLGATVQWGLCLGVSVQGVSVRETTPVRLRVGGTHPSGMHSFLSQFSITFFTEMILLCEFNVYFELKCNT